MADADITNGAPGGPQPLMERMFAWCETTAMMAAAEIGLADRLAAGPRTAAEVATELGAHEQAIGRLLRDLTGTGVVATAGPGRFALTPLGEFLRSDVPGSVRALYRMVSGPLARGLIGGDASVWKGTTAFEEIMGSPFFEYFGQHPEDGTVFNGAMVDFGVTLGTPPVQAYDFSGVRQLVDVGGGRGQLALEVLRSNPEMHGVVFDTPAVVAEAQVDIEKAGLAGDARPSGATSSSRCPPEVTATPCAGSSTTGTTNRPRRSSGAAGRRSTPAAGSFSSRS